MLFRYDNRYDIAKTNKQEIPQARITIPKQDNNFTGTFMVGDNETRTHDIIPSNAATTGIAPPSVTAGRKTQATTNIHVHQGNRLKSSHVILDFFFSDAMATRLLLFS